MVRGIGPGSAPTPPVRARGVVHSGAHCPMRRRPRRRTALSRSASPRHYLRERLDDAPSGVQARDPHRVSGLQLRHPALCTRSAARCNTQQHTSGLRVVPRDTREPPKLRQLGHLPGSSRSPVSGDLFITSELLCRLSYPGRPDNLPAQAPGSHAFGPTHSPPPATPGPGHPPTSISRG